MKSVDHLIVKIIAGEEIGTGFLFAPKTGNELYVLTARHIIVDDTGMQRNPISIEFSTGTTVYEVKPEDFVLTGKNNEVEDFAVICIQQSKVPNEILTNDHLKLTKHSGKEKFALVSGYPKMVDNKWQRTLNMVEVLTDQDYPHQIQLQIGDPVILNYNASALLDGYSGSPIILQSEQNVFFCGIFLSYEKLTRRATGISLSPAEDLLLQNGKEGLELITVETDESILTDLRQIKRNTARVLMRIRNNTGNVALPRTSMRDKLKKIILSNSVTLVTGKAGVGKSSVVKDVVSDLSEDFEIIALQGEQLDKKSLTEVFSEPALKVEHDLVTLLESPGVKKEKIILLDSLEKLLETANAETILEIFGLLNERKDIKIILTCRTYASDQLQIRFLQQFPQLVPFEIGALNDEELNVIADTYPAIKLLLIKPSLRQILEIPFNLDKAVFINAEVLSSGANSEVEFRKIAWEYIIENKGSETSPEKRRLRSEVFEAIARERANQMLPYISLAESFSDEILQSLKQDDLIESDPALGNRYAVSHDIFEDWCLLRFIETNYVREVIENNSIDGFLVAIGLAPAIRRAFRIWISEKIQTIDFSTKQLIEELLNSSSVQQYWKDETVIAVIQSEYSSQFFNSSKNILFKNSFAHFKRCILLMNVACQRPDFSYLPAIEEGRKGSIYTSRYLKPYGPGWVTMVNFISDEIEKLDSHYDIVISFLLEWAKKIGNNPLPPESRNAALILLKYFNRLQQKSEDEESYYRRDKNIKEAAILLLKLVEVVEEESVPFLISVCLPEPENRRNDDRNLTETFRKLTLSFFDSPNVCVAFPKLVIRIAERCWLYTSPTPAEVEKMMKDSPFKSMPTGLDNNRQFGVVGQFESGYFPASSFQTPIYHLLRAAPRSTLHFICRLFNHSVEELWKSDFLAEKSTILIRPEDRFEVSYTLSTGVVVTQKGTLSLWQMYRGGPVATPDLLSSVLMALETWLLNLSKLVDIDRENKFPHIRTRLDQSFDILLMDSKSVSTTAVLLSVAMAYPKLHAHKILPLLKIKQFYLWDKLRKLHETRILTPLGAGDYGRALQEERWSSKKLPHRGIDLENFVMNLSFGEFPTEMTALLDYFYNEKTTDEEWKFALNRMDKRKLKIVGEVENGFLVQAEIDEELKPVAKKKQAILEEATPLSRATSWSIRKLRCEPVEDNSYDTWLVHYNNVSSGEPKSDFGKLHNQPGVLAAVGLRDYFVDLTKEQFEWSFGKVFEIVQYELNHVNDSFSLDRTYSYGAFESGAAFLGLVEAVIKTTGERQGKAKEMLFLSLLFIPTKLEREEMAKAFKERMWAFQPTFALCCVKGLILYSDFVVTRQRILHYQRVLHKHNPPRRFTSKGTVQRFFEILRKPFSKQLDIKKELKNLLAQYNTCVTTLITSVKKEKVDLNFDNYNLSTQFPYHVFEGLMLIPTDIVNLEIEQLHFLLLTYIFQNINTKNPFNDDRIHYETLSKFEEHFSFYLFYREKKGGLKLFKALVDPVFNAEKSERKQVEFVERCLEDILQGAITNVNFAPAFWDYWRYLLNRTIETKNNYFTDVLLFKKTYGVTYKHSWEGFIGNEDFFEPLIKVFAELDPLAGLLSGIGYDYLLPKGILWIQQLLEGGDFDQRNTVYYLEKLTTRIYYDKNHRTIIKRNGKLGDAFIAILDALINNASASAFLIREDMISQRV